MIYFLVFFLSFSLNAATIKVGLVDYPPHIDFKKPLNDSKLFHYINDVFKREDLQVEFIQYPNKRGLLELKKGNIDLLLPYEEPEESVKIFSRPLFYSVPGLCFTKDKFIPILSALRQFKGLRVAIPPGAPVVSVLRDSGAILVNMQGSDIINRGIALTQFGRVDAFYHPSPLKVYYSGIKRYKEVACSFFHGYETGVFIAASPKMTEKKFNLLNDIFNNALDKLSYEYYFAR